MRNKTPLIVIAAIVIAALCLINIGGGEYIHGGSFEAETTRINQISDCKLVKAYVNLDNSGSMKGYTDFAGYPDARKTLVSTITKPLDNFKNTIGSELQIKCGSYRTNDVNAFRMELTTGNILSGAITELDKMIMNAVEESSDTTISILATDMVLSYGKAELVRKRDSWLNKHNLDDLGASIHTALKDANQINVLLLQYYSDFNGRYYCNCTENLENGSAFRNSLMKNRPFYLMVFGTKPMLKYLLANNVFASYDNIYASFGLESSDMITSKYNVSLSGNSNWLINIDPYNPDLEKPGTIWTQTDLGNAKETFEIDFKKFDMPAFVGKEYIVGDYSLSSTIYDVEDISVANEPNLKFRVTLKPFNELPKGQTEAEFTLINKLVWTTAATVDNDDDVNVEDLSVLEKKTWGLSAVIKNIDEVYYGANPRAPEVVARVRFNVSKEIE